MHLLYLDDAGSASNPNEDYLVLGGIAVFESRLYWLTKALDDLADTLSPNPHDVEFHASEISQDVLSHGVVCRRTKRVVSSNRY